MAKHEPMFVTRSETFKFVAGETIHLPCEVSNAGKYNVYIYGDIQFNSIVLYDRKPNKFIAEVRLMCLDGLVSFEAIIWHQLWHQIHIQKAIPFDNWISIGLSISSGMSIRNGTITQKIAQMLIGII